LWEPTPERVAAARITAFLGWLGAEGRGSFASYDELWRWSVTDLEGFWEAIRRYFAVGPDAGGPVLVRGRRAEGARWFPELRLNYADAIGRHPDGRTAVVARDEDGGRREMTFGELRAAAGAAAAGLRRLGVGRGDRVAAVVPNGIEAVVGLLATASIGAVWSSCAPEFGAEGVIDRFGQIEPTVLVAVTGYRYGGRQFDMSTKVAALEHALSGLAATVVVPGAGIDRLGPPPPGARRIDWSELLAEPAPLRPEAVAFDHPLWILYSSGTTGLPKPIVHGHGGIVLEHLKSLAFHSDLGSGDRFFWFSTTGWMMWNYLVGGLLAGATVVAYDGSPRWPDLGALWRLAADEGVTFFGTSAAFVESCRAAGLSPRLEASPRAVRTVGSTGSPLSPAGFAWATAEVGDDVLVASVSGGTDVCTGFLTSCPLLPVRAGELQCSALGAKVEAYDETGRPVVGTVGELVVTEPMPSMPIMLWGDDGRRLHESYFAAYDGVWRHGDWVKLTPVGSSVVYGRSDATLNRGGVRMGTAEFYRVLDVIDGVADSLVVDTSELGRQGELVLLVVPGRPGDEPGDRPLPARLPDSLEEEIRHRLRRQLSPRHVPDRVLAVPALPRTINGKKIEVPLRRILLGLPMAQAVSPSALDRPEALDTVLEVLASAGLFEPDEPNGPATADGVAL